MVFLRSFLMASQSMPELTRCFNRSDVELTSGVALFFFANSSCCCRACSALALMAAFWRGCFKTTDADRVGVVVPEPGVGLLLLTSLSFCCFVADDTNLLGVFVETGDSQTIDDSLRVGTLCGVALTRGAGDGVERAGGEVVVADLEFNVERRLMLGDVCELLSLAWSSLG